MDGSANLTVRKVGSVNKCPSCGAALKAFAAACVDCGHELVNVSANRTIEELTQRFDEIEHQADEKGLVARSKDAAIHRRRAQIIRDFAVPNSREDLQQLLYYIQPKIADSVKPDPNAEDWRAKFAEILNRARKAYEGDDTTLREITMLEHAVATSAAGVLKMKARRNPVVALIVLAGLVASGVVGLMARGNNAKLNECEAAYDTAASGERARLKKVLGDIDGQFKAGHYDEAQLHSARLSWEANAVCRQAEVAAARTLWDNKRVSVEASIKKAAGDMAEVRQRAEAEAMATKQQADRQAGDVNRQLLEQQRASDEKAATAQRVAEAKVATDTRNAVLEAKY